MKFLFWYIEGFHRSSEPHPFHCRAQLPLSLGLFSASLDHPLVDLTDGGLVMFLGKLVFVAPSSVYASVESKRGRRESVGTYWKRLVLVPKSLKGFQCQLGRLIYQGLTALSFPCWEPLPDNGRRSCR